MRRLEKAAQHRRQTRQSFIQELVLSEIAHIEESQRLTQDEVVDQPRRAKRAPDPASMGGLGIASILKQRQSNEDNAVPVESSSSPVVVNVGNTQTATSDGKHHGELDRLALYVIGGDDFMRDTRKRTAVDILRASAVTDEELNVLVARLEEIVATKTKVATKEKEVGVGKIARMAFDKLASLLGD
jgi:hypothetical protein